MKFVMPLAVALVMTGTLANAGGLFGDGGLIGGFVGEIFEPIENEILTPFAQGVVVVTGAAGGAAAGALVGAPNLGGAAGALVGDAINDLAAGE